MRITLCGSTRFRDAFEEWNRKLTLAGHVVYSVSMFGNQTSADAGKGKEGLTPVSDEEKMILDLIHLAKIDNSDMIAVLNVGGYIGESTRREILWAKIRGKPANYLEPDITQYDMRTLL